MVTIQVLREVRRKQVAYFILLRLSEHVQSLKKYGSLEEKEMNKLHEDVDPSISSRCSKVLEKDTKMNHHTL